LKSSDFEKHVIDESNSALTKLLDMMYKEIEEENEALKVLLIFLLFLKLV